MKILALEPSITLLKLLSDNMQHYGYQFQGALDIGLARNALQMGYQPEIIAVNFCFCVYPMILELEEFVKQLNYPYKATMAILDSESEPNYLHARSMGFQSIVIKPLSIKTFINEIESLTGINNKTNKISLAFSSTDTRREARLHIAIEVTIKTVDEETGQFFQEQTVTEDISLNGTSILTLLDIKIGSMVSLNRATQVDACIAIVRGSFIGNDRIRRLNLQVIGKSWQDFYDELTQRVNEKALNSQETKLKIDPKEILNNRYKIERELGKGGFGIVYQAKDLVGGNKVALKLLIETQDMVQHSINQQFFEREIKILSKIEHPNIISVLDSGFSSNGSPFFVMNYIEGMPLDQLIKIDSLWSVDKVLNILKQLCPALHSIHLKNIIHRDLKPANIMIEKVGDGQRAILLDLGIAKMVRGSNDNSLMQELTKTGMTVGTLQYISPEQCLDLTLDSGVDIYSLGIVVYQLLTGKMPFKTSTLAELIIAHVQGKPIPMREVNPNISNAIESVVFWALAKNREQRPKTMMEFLEHFERAANQSLEIEAEELDQKSTPQEEPTILFSPEN
ncbi:MAG: serine/threonine protein kinase [Acidobacteria bacterium]|nr:serine/threonine protein kinase [Acidobacteriota bacterium]